MKQVVPVVIVTVLAVATRIPYAAEITDKDVRQAIERGVEFLKSQQDPSRGNWPEHATQPGGLTALCTLALLNAGLGPEDPAVQKALEYLRGFEKPDMTYSVALRTMVFCNATPKKDALLIEQHVRWLEAVQIQEGGTKGAWAYSGRQGLGSGDNSNTQFALLALNEAERVGVKVNPRTWLLALDYWQRSQKPDGSWGYEPGLRATGSMTCAGIASTVIAAGHTGSGSARVVGGTISCCGQHEELKCAERGLAWLGKHFTVRANPGDTSWLIYYLYGVERIGRLTGRRFIGRHDWYREGAELLVREQEQIRGYWRGLGQMESNPLVATPLALLFLAKGRRAVVIAKAKYGQDDGWDLHAGGVPNLTRHLETAWGRELAWQTVDVNVATVEDLLETPILFLSGKQSLALTPEQQENFRSYVEQGGFIFAEACDGKGCDGKAFDESFRALMKRLFPNSALRLLPPDHAVWFAETAVKSKYLPPLYGIDACCRTSVVYCPQNLSCLWELSPGGRESDLPEEAREEIDTCVRIGQNVVAYATNRVLKEKLDRPNVALDDEGRTTEGRDVLVVPKLSHGGGSDDAPNALANLMRFIREKTEVRVLSERRLLSPLSASLAEYPIVFVHGRRSFRWNAAERTALATYVKNGGFVFADAICASPQFAAAFRSEMEAIFPGARFERVPVDHPLFSDEFSGFAVTEVTLNEPKLRQDDDRLDASHLPVSPLLEGLQVDGRLAVVLSPYDISCALESNASLECKGYTKADAAKLGTNIILYAMQQ